jgi:hypothetical protein
VPVPGILTRYFPAVQIVAPEGTVLTETWAELHRADPPSRWGHWWGLIGVNLQTWRGIKLILQTPQTSGVIVVEETGAEVSDVFGVGAAPF